MDQLAEQKDLFQNHQEENLDLSLEADKKIARSFMGRIEWEMIVIGINPMPILVWCLGDGLEWIYASLGRMSRFDSFFNFCLFALTCWTTWPFIWKQKTSRLVKFLGRSDFIDSSSSIA